MSIDLIVVGIGESPGSQAAARWAGEAAAQLGARIVAVHAYEPLDHLDDIGPGVDFADVREDVAALMEQVWCQTFRASDVPFEMRLAEGRPAAVLMDVAREVDADLIVVGTRRMGAVAALAMGSTADEIMREALRPVVVIHPPEE
jgi:nucleotide-binding universal stress UspA family protein